ncbi:MAG: hypothetical protein K2L96_01705 [Muribaculaceae bacterium]|nr:hypothetical protein [Muribaculaceae bacterium]
MKDTIPPPYEPAENEAADKALYSSEAIETAVREAADDEDEALPFFLFQPRKSFWED